MVRRPFLLLTIVMVMVVLTAAVIVIAVRRGGLAASAGGRSQVPVQVSVGAVTPRAARISVGGKTYPLSPGPAGTRQGRIHVTAGTGGVAVVRDAGGQVVGSAPVWAVPGQPVRTARVTCRSTAFDEFLLTPGVAGPDPVGVDVLWALASRGQTGVDVAALGRLICAGLRGHPGQLARPTAAEIAAYRRMFDSYATMLRRLAAQLPPLSASASGVRVSLTSGPASSGTAPALRLTAAFLPSATDIPCTGDAEAVSSDSGSVTPLSLCTNGHTTNAENGSAAWAFLYDTPSGHGQASGLPASPAAIVPGRTSDFPSLEKITGAVIHDYVTGKEQTACLVASWVDLCHAGKAPRSALSSLFNLVEAGQASTAAAAGYYAIAWGDGQGDQNSFPAGASSAEAGAVQDSMDLTFISSVVAPTLGLLLDQQLKLDLDPGQLPLLLPVFNDLADSALKDAAKGVPATNSGRLHAVIDTAKDLFAQPQLLGDIAEAFVPGLKDLTEKVAEQLGEYLAGLEIPVAGWAALVVKTIAKGPAAVTLALSIAGMFQALTEPSYSSWPPMLTAAAAFTLPLTALGATPSCPAPPTPVAIPPGAPGKPACEWVVSADLDGNGRPDRLVTWQTQNRRGAVAFLDDGSTHPLQYPPSALAGTDSFPWASVTPGAMDTNAPARIFQLTSSRRQQVLLIDSIGAVGDGAVLIGLAGDGSLRLVANEHGQVQNVGTADDLGCATQSGQRAFVESAQGRGEPGVSGGPAPGYGISRFYYVVSPDLRMRFTGYQGSVVPSQPITDPFRNGCAASVPVAAPASPGASTAAGALTGLLAAAAAGNRTQGSAFVGGGLADFSGSNNAEPDVWSYLTATPGVTAANWVNHPVSCSSMSGAVTCLITGADGEPLSAEVDNTGNNWVVTGLGAG